MTESEVVDILYPQTGTSGPYGEGGPVRGRRFTQDTPILPEVWIAYGKNPSEKQSLLLSPNADSNISELVTHLRTSLARLNNQDPRRIFLAYNESHVMAELTFEELVLAVLPLSVWWRQKLGGAELLRLLERIRTYEGSMADLLHNPARQIAGIPSDVLDLVRIAGAIKMGVPLRREDAYYRDLAGNLAGMFTTYTPYQDFTVPPLWSVFLCREATSAVLQSRVSIKADAAIRVFELSCKDLAWAVIDSGIDVEHDAFIEWPASEPREAGTVSAPAPTKPKSRVVASYDFARIAQVMKAAFSEDALAELKALVPQADEEELRAVADDLGPRLLSGRPLDWQSLEPLLRIRPVDGRIPAPVNEHGTHVAGILAADWRKLAQGEPKPYPDYVEPRESVTGVCPDLRLYNLRVIRGDGSGDEFAVLSALQFVRYLNVNKDKVVVHGVNLSFSLPQQVKSFACGSSPVCQECERLVNSGVVVVTAAGNRGYVAGEDGFEWYRNLSITDPGNADAVITVGATHRSEPHRYGVSYFSSRGPTGDGRMKPDLVAPGEKIRSVVPGSSSIVALDGTSMAAPHVSGAAALLMTRHRELIGRPRKVKEVLCATATDLGRERIFQGAGMLDVLRALQSV